jgi:hypothetical protein
MNKSKPLSFTKAGKGKLYVTVDPKLFEEKFSEKNAKQVKISAAKKKGIKEDRYKDFDLIRDLRKKKCKNCCLCGSCGI